MTARDLETLLKRSRDLDELWSEVLACSNQDPDGDTHPLLSAFSKDELRAFVSYCCNAVESAPEVPNENFVSVKDLTYGTTLYHVRARDWRGDPARGRVNGKVKTWKRQPGRFEVPMKFGFSEAFTLRQDDFLPHDPLPHNERTWDDVHNWRLTEEEALFRPVGAKNIKATWTRMNPAPNEPWVRLQLVDLKITCGWRHNVADPMFDETRDARTEDPFVLTQEQIEERKWSKLKGVGNNKIWSLDALDAWRSSSAWKEFQTPTKLGVSRAFFAFDAELPPWAIEHREGCSLSLPPAPDGYGWGDSAVAMVPTDASRKCTCGALGEPIENPRRRR